LQYPRVFRLFCVNKRRSILQVYSHSTAVIEKRAFTERNYFFAVRAGESEHFFAVGVGQYISENSGFPLAKLARSAAYKAGIVFFYAYAAGANKERV
jgi:hypothetical protein